MHHLRKVSDIRQKIRTGNVSFDQWKGAVMRKQIPLCHYHHQLYHKGELNHSELNPPRGGALPPPLWGGG